MKDKVFIDSNVILYLFSNIKLKKQLAKKIVKENPMISVQVLSEVSNVLYEKFKTDPASIITIINRLSDICRIKNISLKTITSALEIVQKYKYSYYDSLIISSAVENQCAVLYSEDMSDGQIIEKKLKIVNPFK